MCAANSVGHHRNAVKVSRTYFGRSLKTDYYENKYYFDSCLLAACTECPLHIALRTEAVFLSNFH